MSSDDKYYKLSSELRGHEQDVRAVCALSNGMVATGSRDNSVRVWDPADPKSCTVLHGHQHFVGSLVSLFPTVSHPTRLFASGGYDNVINVWDAGASSGASDTPILTLIGHEKPVVSLSVTPDGHIISGSWDSTARVWIDGECVDVLKGHEAAIWAVLGMPDGSILTASADRTIKVWRQTNPDSPSSPRECVATLQRHTDVVRGLAVLPGVGFVSCANDGLVLVWSASGEPLMELSGHTAYVYSVAVVEGVGIVSCGEDRSVRVWVDGQQKQSLPHANVVWSVAALPNRDVVSGSSDGIARIWSADPERYANELVLQNYEAELASSQQQAVSSIGALQMDKLAGPEALLVPGNRDGESKVVKQGNKAEAYQWSAADQKWIDLGEVVDSATNSQKGVLEGKEYDQIFDIDINDGAKYKIGYNKGDNPYQVAQDFIWKNDLSQEFLEQIAQFIFKNAQEPVVLGAAPAAAPYVDPLTGGGAYRTGSGSTSSRSNNSNNNNNNNNSNSNNNNNNAPKRDPFNPFIAGSGAYLSEAARQEMAARGGAPVQSSSTSSSSSSAPQNKYYPQRTMLFFEDTSKIDEILKKINEFSSALASDQATKAFALNDDIGEVQMLTDMLNKVRDVGRYHSTQYSDAQERFFSTRLMSWPADRLFPILDMARLLVLHPDFAQHHGELLRLPGRYNLLQSIMNSGAAGPAPNQMLMLRTMANWFKHDTLRRHVLANSDQVLDCVEKYVQSDNKMIRQAAVTVLLNFTVGVTNANYAPPAQSGQWGRVLRIASRVLATETESIAQLRGLIAAGTLLSSDRSLRSSEGVSTLKDSVAKLASGSQDADVKACAGFLLADL